MKPTAINKPTTIVSSKGAASRSAVSPAHQSAMEAGAAQSRTLSEVLVIDFQRLLEACAPKAAKVSLVDPKLGVTTRMQHAAKNLMTAYGDTAGLQFCTHASDTMRGFAAYCLSNAPGLTLADQLEHIKPLANDPHFGVREWAWLALRPNLVARLAHAIELLTPWSLHESANIRRFASEALRPRGVWCAHIAELKANPGLALPLIAPLRSDASRYVQDSVANWLNDASKDQPDWVRQLCASWLAESQTTQTAYIVKRALRSLR
jgi:3-methyladenine DNA glycosylase AlkC